MTADLHRWVDLGTTLVFMGLMVAYPRWWKWVPRGPSWLAPVAIVAAAWVGVDRRAAFYVLVTLWYCRERRMVEERLAIENAVKMAEWEKKQVQS